MKTRAIVAALIAYFTFGICSTAFCKSHSGVVTIEVDLLAQAQGQIARLWIPYPVSDREQLISDIRTSGNYSAMAVYTDRTYGTAILYAELPRHARSRKLKFSFAVERQEVRCDDLPLQESNWNPGDYALFLKPTTLGPIDGEVKKLSDSITRGKKTLVEKAKAIYDWTCENMYRDPKVVGCGKGDVCQLLKTRGGKCTDISSVFIALARAAGVPCREVFGIRLGQKTSENITAWQHCWAEFFLPGYGWVPVDPADVRKAMLREKLALQDAKTKEYRDYFWGGIDAYRVVISRGRDITLNPPQEGAPLNTFAYPYAEVGGNPLDFYDPASFIYSITYRQK
ncbi:MAG: transglutaminase domain-containing protein [Deltaproteobacteria bacterium]|nr:transglutaminase domain-containing protein [Deltaproteobacteria bacterium]MBW2071568.1 transglutaminase domain-containing protein [Deltaproteobacteria bacterium]